MRSAAGLRRAVPRPFDRSASNRPTRGRPSAGSAREARARQPAGLPGRPAVEARRAVCVRLPACSTQSKRRPYKGMPPRKRDQRDRRCEAEAAAMPIRRGRLRGAIGWSVVSSGIAGRVGGGEQHTGAQLPSPRNANQPGCRLRRRPDRREGLENGADRPIRRPGRSPGSPRPEPQSVLLRPPAADHNWPFVPRT